MLRENPSARTQASGYSMKYAAVEQTTGGKPVELFRIGGSTENLNDYPAEQAAWLAGQTEGKWDDFSAHHQFIKRDASPVSPSGRWRIEIRIENSTAPISTSVTKTVSVGDPEEQGGLLAERQVKGKVLGYGADQQWINSDWIVFATDGERSVQLRDAVTGEHSLSRTMDGNLAAYWSPKEDLVVVEWARFPTVGGGTDRVSLFEAKLPRNGKERGSKASAGEHD